MDDGVLYNMAYGRYILYPMTVSDPIEEEEQRILCMFTQCSIIAIYIHACWGLFASAFLVS